MSIRIRGGAPLAPAWSRWFWRRRRHLHPGRNPRRGQPPAAPLSL